MVINNPRGQGLVEALLCVPLISLFIFGMTLILYRGILYYYVDYQLHEALVCTQASSLNTCQQTLDEKINGFLLAKEKPRIYLSRNIKATEGEVFLPLFVPLKVRKTLNNKI